MTALPYLVHFESTRGGVWINPAHVALVEPYGDGLARVVLDGGTTGPIVNPPQGDDFTSDPVEAVCRRLAGLPLCDGSHPEPHLRQVPDVEREQGQIEAMRSEPSAVDHAAVYSARLIVEIERQAGRGVSDEIRTLAKTVLPGEPARA